MTANVLQPSKSDPAWSWLALSLISGIGYKKIRALIKQLGSVEELLKTSPQILVEQFQLSEKLAGLITKAAKTQSFLIEKRIIGETPGIRLLCPDSSGYPLSLQQISTPPTVLYWQGELQDAENPCLAFVGSRGCTAKGRFIRNPSPTCSTAQNMIIPNSHNRTYRTCAPNNCDKGQ